MMTRRRGETSRASALACICVVVLCHLHSAPSFVPSPIAPCRRDFRNILFKIRHPSPRQIQQHSEDDDPRDTFRVEEEASQKVARRLMMPRVIMTSISQTIMAFGWGFLVVTFVLQALGYALVMDDSTGLRIDTLDAQKFQQEVIRSMKELSQGK
jgi:hypothetical protein